MEDPQAPEQLKSRYRNARFGEKWLETIKYNYKMRNLRVNGERSSVPLDWKNQLQGIIRCVNLFNFPAKDVFNFDETGLFYRAQPRYTLAAKGDDGAGRKDDKTRVTLGVLVNGDGSEKSVMIIGKAKTPHGTSAQFWSDLGIDYYSQGKAWMNSTIFQDFLSRWDSELKKEGRSVVSEA